MAKARQITINGATGEGYAEIIHNRGRGPKYSCKGVAVFEGNSRSIIHDAMSGDGTGEYQGVLYNKKEESIETFPVVITRTHEGSGSPGSMRVQFQASGNPYSG